MEGTPDTNPVLHCDFRRRGILSYPYWGVVGYVVYMGADYRLHRVSATGGRSQPLVDSSLVRNATNTGWTPHWRTPRCFRAGVPSS